MRCAMLLAKHDGQKTKQKKVGLQRRRKCRHCRREVEQTPPSRNAPKPRSSRNGPELLQAWGSSDMSLLLDSSNQNAGVYRVCLCVLLHYRTSRVDETTLVNFDN